MHGKSGGLRVRVAGPSIVVGVIALLASCASNVPQDKKTGPDGKIKGAKEMVLDNNEARATGIVTYPGGDRVDWKMIQLPDKKRGTLEVKLQWTPPRPGLQLAFDVFDEWNELLASSSKKTGKKKARGRSRSATVENAKGKYFIRVYAVERGDAGKYKLAVEFKEAVVGPAYDPLKLEIPDPPKLLAVPDYVPPCDDENFDKNKKECKDFCPSSGAPPNWAPCKGRCPDPPDINIEACWKIMPCPTPPNRNVVRCTPDKFPPCPDKRNKDPNNPNCDAPPEPIVGRVVNRVTEGGYTVVTVAVNADHGIPPKGEGWKGQVISGSDVKDRAVPGGDVQISNADKTRIRGRTKLSLGQVDATPYVRFVPTK
jgi:hypothetical protein